MKHLLLLILFLSFLAGHQVFSQESTAPDDAAQAVDERMEARNSEFERLLQESLSAAESGEWDRALALLDAAEDIRPEDPRIADYRASFLELAALESAQVSWSDGTPSEVTVADPGTGDPAGDGNSDPASGSGEPEEPRFTIDRGEMDPRESPVLTRDFLRSEVSLKFFTVDPDSSEAVNGWNTTDEFLYSSLGVDVAGWLPLVRRSIGFNFRYGGYAYLPGDPQIMFNTLDLGINIRGFLAESKTSRLEIGLDFGGAFQSSLDVAQGDADRNWSLFLGLWFSDPLLFHLFNADSLENLLFGGGIRIYSSAAEEIFDTINYRIDSSVVFSGGHLGIRLEWWDFVYTGTRTNMLSFSILGGYRF